MEVKKIFDFLKQVRANNNREWFNANKDVYLAAKKESDELAQLLIALVAEVDPDAGRMDVKDVTYRIYRDTRFSADKTPYKTHIGYFINPPYGKKSMRYGYYFHLEPGNSFVCSGNIPGPGEMTRALRQDIYDNIEEYLEIIDAPGFRERWTEIGMDPLQKAPQGFPKDWEYIDLLKPRAFGATMPVADSYYTKSGLADRLRPAIVEMKRLNDFFNFTLDEMGIK